jgi:undecaprenyl-phosphate 4-deoxy-4-formamido-L-arabinose transferase
VAVSVVVPVHDEEANLAELHRRLAVVLGGMEAPSEIVFVNDGSRDGSAEVLEQIRALDPRVTVVELAWNAGQHAAVLAGLRLARGEVAVTLDADLQNPPEEIPKLLAKIGEGFDVVGGVRSRRHDPLLRRAASAALARLGARRGGADYGCMLRAYRREVVRRMLRCRERTLFLPALAESLAQRVADVPVAHDERRHGRSRYDLIRLLRLGVDFLAASSTAPFEMVAALGALAALAGVAIAAFAVLGSALGAGDLQLLAFAFLVVLLGGLLSTVGLVGALVVRLHAEVRGRPRYAIRAVRRGTEKD